MNDKLREALGLAKTKLQLYRQQHSGAYVGGMEYTALMKLIDEALAASKQEPQDIRKCEFCGCETNAKRRACCDRGRAADDSKPEPQAQAAPEAVWRNGEHEYRKVDGRWQLHYLPTDDGIPLRYCHAFESDKLDAIAKKDAALDACVEALESYSKSPYVKKQHPKRHAAGNAAITQAKEVRK